MIIHADLDAFYASVEELDFPELKGKPIIVGGKPNSRGVVCTASYAARKFGVRSAMPCAKAYKLCPQGVFVPPRFERYKELSQKIFSIYREVTNDIEPLSLDEAYLDASQNKLGFKDTKEMALYLKRKVTNETGLTVSMGIAPNKFLAKIASDLEKPNGIFEVIDPESFILEIPLKDYHGIGPASLRELHKFGLRTTQDLRDAGPIRLKDIMGKWGTRLYDLAWGIDPRKVESTRVSKSIGAETTLSENIETIEDVYETFAPLIDEIWERSQKKKKQAKTISIKVRFSDFETLTRSKSLQDPIDAKEQIVSLVSTLFDSIKWKGDRPIRLLGATLSNFQPSSYNQLKLPMMEN